MKKLILVFISFFTICVVAQQENDWFEAGNTFYKEGKYNKAIESYKSIEKKGKVSSELYFNIGNCYYKLNEVAQTIFYYEKALQLNPKNKDASNNLIFANRLTIDRVEPLAETVFQKLNRNVFLQLHQDTWAISCVVFAVIIAILFLFFYYSDKSSKRRLYFILFSLSVLLFCFCFAVSFQQYSYHKNKREAIVFVKKIAVQSEPIQDSEDVFTLHEGTKVSVIDQVDFWKKIKLADGRIGWLKSENIKEL